MQLRLKESRLILFGLAFFSATLLYIFIQGLHLKIHHEFKQISKTFNKIELFQNAALETSAHKTPQQNKKYNSAFVLFGLADEHLMRKIDVKRPLFNFTLHPWKILSTPVDNGRESHTNWSMIVVVKSKWKNWERRKTARDTWASLKNVLGVKLRSVFIVGLASQPEGESDLAKENQEFGDLLQIHSADTYRLVGMKTIAGMQWVVENFPSHWMYTSADDDMFPNLIDIYEDIEKMMREQLEQRSESSSQQTIYSEEIITRLPIHCGFSYRDRPFCWRSGKWAINKNEYSLQTYPPYCHGGWYSMPISLARGIHETSRHHEFFRLDDVWVTSLLRLTYFHELRVDEYFGVNASDHHIGIRASSKNMARHGRPLTLTAWRDIKLRIQDRM